MSIRVHILTPGFTSPNGTAFLFPLHVHRGRLSDLEIRFRCLTHRSPEVADCDVLIIDNCFYLRRWARDESAALDEIAGYAERVGAVLYFDPSDSTGWLQPQVLPFVTRYYKPQLLKDRAGYLHPHYGNRIYADYYHRVFGVEDDEPVVSRPVASADDVAKLRVSWHSGLADYSLWGLARMGLRRYLSFDSLLAFPRSFTSVRQPRPVGVACRFGVAYDRDTVAFQRRRIRETLGQGLPTQKLGRRAYFAEMRAARIVVSPFGYGEITLKDFEALLCGALLLKPDMAHLETWPDLFRDGQTIATHRWDLSDVERVLDAMLADDARREEMAERGQALYRRYIASEQGYEEFCLRFREIVDDAVRASVVG